MFLLKFIIKSYVNEKNERNVKIDFSNIKVYETEEPYKFKSSVSDQVFYFRNKKNKLVYTLTKINFTDKIYEYSVIFEDSKENVFLEMVKKHFFFWHPFKKREKRKILLFILNNS